MSAQPSSIAPPSTENNGTTNTSHISRSNSEPSMHGLSQVERSPWWSQPSARRTIGIILLGITVFCWTGSNFLASSIFANDSFSKPYFVCYINTATFILALLPILAKHAYENGLQAVHPRHMKALWEKFRTGRHRYGQVPTEDTSDEGSQMSSIRPLDETGSLPTNSGSGSSSTDGLDLYETAKLSLEFCILWFAANYFASACLQYASVASTTILNSTSSVWTLIIGSLANVERFTIKKAIGVFASLLGIALISTVDLSGDSDKNRGSFPHKTMAQVTLGDVMALIGAVLYGVYAILMKKRIGDESKVNMPLFFGLVGLLNVLIMWPGFIILHLTKFERFELPSTKRIWLVILYNSLISMFSDITWAYAVLLTTPLVVTLGLSLTIPLSLVGQMILQSQFASALYWVGAGIVFLSFIFINHESNVEDEKAEG